MVRSYAGELLVSRPDMRDPNFDGTITFLLEHNDEGAVGVVLNRPSAMTVEDTFADWLDLVGQPAQVFQGGPVQTDGIIALGRRRPGIESDDDYGLPLGLASVDLTMQPALAAAEGIDGMRIFAGYAGWGAGQLEGEIASDAWWVLPGTLDDVFTDEPRKLWPRVLKRGGRDLRWHTTYTPDPSLN